MTRNDFIKKLNSFIFITPIQIVKTDGSSSGLLVPKDIECAPDNAVFTDGDAIVAIPYSEVKDICLFGKVKMVVSQI